LLLFFIHQSFLFFYALSCGIKIGILHALLGFGTVMISFERSENQHGYKKLVE